MGLGVLEVEFVLFRTLSDGDYGDGRRRSGHAHCTSALRVTAAFAGGGDVKRVTSGEPMDADQLASLTTSIALQNQLLLAELNKKRELRKQIHRMRLRYQNEALHDYAAFMAKSVELVDDMRVLAVRPDSPARAQTPQVGQSRRTGSSSASDQRSAALSALKSPTPEHGLQSADARETNPQPSANIQDALSSLVTDVFGEVDAQAVDEVPPASAADPALASGGDKPADSTAATLLSKMALKGGIFSRPSPAGLFRAGAFALRFIVRVSRSIATRVARQRASQIQEFSEVVDLYEEMARAWLLPAVKFPIGSLLAPSCALDLDLRPGPTAAVHTLLRLKRPNTKTVVAQIGVRLKHCFEKMVEMTAPGATIPVALVGFVNRYLISPGNVFPDAYLLPSEKSAIQLDRHGFTTALSVSAQRLMLANFFVVRVLMRIVVAPWEAGLGRKPRDRAATRLTNLKVIASIVYRVVCDLLRIPGDDKVRNDMDLIDPKDGTYALVKDVVNENTVRLDAFLTQFLVKIAELAATERAKGDQGSSESRRSTL